MHVPRLKVWVLLIHVLIQQFFHKLSPFFLHLIIFYQHFSICIFHTIYSYYILPGFCHLLCNAVDFPHSLPSRSSHLHTAIPEANLLVAFWKSFPLLSQTLGDSLEKVDKFCYLGDVLDADGGCDSAVTTKVRSAWKKFLNTYPF